MGVVALHHDVVDTDHVALGDGGGVVNGAEPEIAAQHLAREQVRGPGVALGARRRVRQHVVGAVHQHRDPANATFGEAPLAVPGSAAGRRTTATRPAANKRVDGEDGGQQLERRVR